MGDPMAPGPRRGGGRGGRGEYSYDDEEDANLCWEIVRVLLIVALILAAVVGGAWYLSSALEASSAAPSLTVNDEEGRELSENDA